MGSSQRSPAPWAQASRVACEGGLKAFGPATPNYFKIRLLHMGVGKKYLAYDGGTSDALRATIWAYPAEAIRGLTSSPDFTPDFRVLDSVQDRKKEREREREIEIEREREGERQRDRERETVRGFRA